MKIKGHLVSLLGSVVCLASCGGMDFAGSPSQVPGGKADLVATTETLILPVSDIGTTSTDPYQTTTTWINGDNLTVEHTTIYDPSGSSVDLHFIDGACAGTMYTDVNGGWTFVDCNGIVTYMDVWDEALGDYRVLVGLYGSWMEFDEFVLQPMGFWSGPSIAYDWLTLESGGGMVYLMASAASGSSSSTPISTVSGRMQGLLKALLKVRPTALTAKVELIKQLSREPRAKAIEVRAELRAAGKGKRRNSKSL